MLHQIVSKIVKEFKAIQGVPLNLLNKDSEISIPGMIGVGDNLFLYVNNKIDSLIAQASQLIHERYENYRNESSLEDLKPTIRKSFGSALTKIDLNNPVEHNSSAVLNDVLTSIKLDWDHQKSNQEHCFACTLFGFEVAPFTIGQVRFETRQDWLHRRLIKGQIDAITARRVLQRWQGVVVRKRKPNASSMDERDILDLVGNCSYVASVATTGLTQALARERALVAARIALMAVALMWKQPAKRLAGFNLAVDRELRFLTTMTIIDNHLLTSRRKENLTVDGTFRIADWLRAQKEWDSEVNLFSEVVDAWLAQAGIGGRYSTLSKCPFQKEVSDFSGL